METHSLSKYAANAAFLATLYSDYLDATDTPGWYCGPTTFFSTQVLRDFSRSQINYILGKNPHNMSYVVGFGSCDTCTSQRSFGPEEPESDLQRRLDMERDTKENPNTIEGAMVAGPDKHDGFHDVGTNYNYTEPTLVGNAGLVSTLVASSVGGGIYKNTIFSAVPPSFQLPPPEP